MEGALGARPRCSRCLSWEGGSLCPPPLASWAPGVLGPRMQVRSSSGDTGSTLMGCKRAGSLAVTAPKAGTMSAAAVSSPAPAFHGGPTLSWLQRAVPGQGGCSTHQAPRVCELVGQVPRWFGSQRGTRGQAGASWSPVHSAIIAPWKVANQQKRHSLLLLLAAGLRLSPPGQEKFPKDGAGLDPPGRSPQCIEPPRCLGQWVLSLCTGSGQDQPRTCLGGLEGLILPRAGGWAGADPRSSAGLAEPRSSGQWR